MPDLRVFLTCPRCGHTWHAATIDLESWWGSGVTAGAIARICYCVKCHHAPPMTIAHELLDGGRRENGGNEP